MEIQIYLMLFVQIINLVQIFQWHIEQKNHIWKKLAGKILKIISDINNFLITTRKVLEGYGENLSLIKVEIHIKICMKHWRFFGQFFLKGWFIIYSQITENPSEPTLQAHS